MPTWQIFPALHLALVKKNISTRTDLFICFSRSCKKSNLSRRATEKEKQEEKEKKSQTTVVQKFLKLCVVRLFCRETDSVLWHFKNCWFLNNSASTSLFFFLLLNAVSYCRLLSGFYIERMNVRLRSNHDRTHTHTVHTPHQRVTHRACCASSETVSSVATGGCKSRCCLQVLWKIRLELLHCDWLLTNKWTWES